MASLKPEVKERLLWTNPQVALDDIDEYEHLLSWRFLLDPDMPKSPEEAAEEDAREVRWQELHQKLFHNSCSVIEMGYSPTSRLDLLATRPHVVKPDEADDPLHIGTSV